MLHCLLHADVNQNTTVASLLNATVPPDDTEHVWHSRMREVRLMQERLSIRDGRRFHTSCTNGIVETIVLIFYADVQR